ncbi:hypothetical protein ERO13_A03G133105v2 [Gossypium hirsutum]|nr:hypothetical protein ERO13_A03G133105v2 [Gossypium hirsutum]
MLGCFSKKEAYIKRIGGGSFSPCKWDANQMWELNGTGSLVNSYSGLCATVDY